MFSRKFRFQDDPNTSPVLHWKEGIIQKWGLLLVLKSVKGFLGEREVSNEQRVV